MTQTVSWSRVYLRGERDPKGPSGGVPAGIAIRPHWFTAWKDNAGSMCDTCFGWSDDCRHLYEVE